MPSWHSGYPNRFEDTIEASAYAGIVARKLVARGFVAQQAAPIAHPMLTGLLWWLWSSQNTSYLDPAVVEGQTGTLRVMLDDLAGIRSKVQSHGVRNSAPLPATWTPY